VRKPGTTRAGICAFAMPRGITITWLHPAMCRP
jgi:hypothetical protein